MDISDPTSSDPILSLPPVKRAVYFDKTFVLMADMSRLAYIPFEQPQDKDLDQASARYGSRKTPSMRETS